jgi:hypothetical protein
MIFNLALGINMEHTSIISFVHEKYSRTTVAGVGGNPW